MKATDIQECALCGKGVGHAGPVFYTIEFRQWGLDHKGIQRTHGLELFFGGGGAGAALASILGDNPDIAQPLGEPVKSWICLACSLKPTAPLIFSERN